MMATFHKIHNIHKLDKVQIVHKLCSRLLLPIAIVALWGCESTTQESARTMASDPQSSTEPVGGLSPRQLESRLSNSSRVAAIEGRLAALRGYLLGDDLRAAQRLIQDLNASALTPRQARQLRLLNAQRLALEGSFDQALDLINGASSLEQASDLLLSHAQVLISMGQGREAVELLVRRDAQERTQYWHDVLWKALVSIPPWQQQWVRSDSAASQAYDEMQSWWRLASRLLEAGNLEQQQRLLWRALDSSNGPFGQDPIPRPLRLIAETPNSAIRVGLILPLSGSLRAFGNAFLDGFTTAWFAAELNSKVTFTIYDADRLSSATDYSRLASDLIKDRIQLAIGPVSRSRIDLIQAVLPRNLGWIALNRVDNQDSLGDGQFELQVSTEDEVNALARRIQSHGATRVLAYYSESGWSMRAMETLQETLGADRLIGMVELSGVAAVTEEVGLSLLVDGSEARIRSIRRLLQGDVETETRRRQDIDALVSLVDGSLSAALHPALRYHDASDLPVFGTSRMMRDVRESDHHVFEGAQLFELPWNLNLSALKRQLRAEFGQTSPTIETFRAVGVDCFRLADRFHLLGEIQQQSLFDALYGATGLLRVSSNQISRDMVWSQVRSGGIDALTDDE